jgi:hypothetical protein
LPLPKYSTPPIHRLHQLRYLRCCGFSSRLLARFYLRETRTHWNEPALPGEKGKHRTWLSGFYSSWYNERNRFGLPSIRFQAVMLAKRLIWVLLSSVLKTL